MKMNSFFFCYLAIIINFILITLIVLLSSLEFSLSLFSYYSIHIDFKILKDHRLCQAYKTLAHKYSMKMILPMQIQLIISMREKKIQILSLLVDNSSLIIESKRKTRKEFCSFVTSFCIYACCFTCVS